MESLSEDLLTVIVLKLTKFEMLNFRVNRYYYKFANSLQDSDKFWQKQLYKQGIRIPVKDPKTLHFMIACGKHNWHDAPECVEDECMKFDLWEYLIALLDSGKAKISYIDDKCKSKRKYLHPNVCAYIEQKGKKYRKKMVEYHSNFHGSDIPDFSHYISRFFDNPTEKEKEDLFLNLTRKIYIRKFGLSTEEYLDLAIKYSTLDGNYDIFEENPKLLEDKKYTNEIMKYEYNKSYFDMYKTLHKKGDVIQKVWIRFLECISNSTLDPNKINKERLTKAYNRYKPIYSWSINNEVKKILGNRIEITDL